MFVPSCAPKLKISSRKDMDCFTSSQAIPASPPDADQLMKGVTHVWEHVLPMCPGHTLAQEGIRSPQNPALLPLNQDDYRRWTHHSIRNLRLCFADDRLHGITCRQIFDRDIVFHVHRNRSHV